MRVTKITFFISLLLTLASFFGAAYIHVEPMHTQVIIFGSLWSIVLFITGVSLLSYYLM